MADTPLTEENLLSWLRKNVQESPRSTDIHGEPVDNSVSHLLSRMLVTNDINNYQNYSKSDLYEEVLDFCMNGVKGYTDMTESELLQRVREEFLENNVGFDSLEDLLLHVGLSAESEQEQEDENDEA